MNLAAGIILISLVLVIIISSGRQLINVLFFNHAPLIFSRRKVLKIIAQNLNLAPGQIFYELGAGTAPLTRRLAKRYPDNKFVAVEYSLLPYVLGRLATLGRPNIAWRKADFFQLDLSPADYLYCFLNVKTMRRLESKLLADCKPGATVISYIFLLPNCPDAKIIPVGQEKIHFYRLNNIDKNS